MFFSLSKNTPACNIFSFFATFFVKNTPWLPLVADSAHTFLSLFPIDSPFLLFSDDLKWNLSPEFDFFFPAEGRTFLRTLGSQRTSVRTYVKKGLFFKWPWYEKQNETERVYVHWPSIYTYIDSENVFWLQTDFDTACFGSTISLSEKHCTVKIHWIFHNMTFFDCILNCFENEKTSLLFLLPPTLFEIHKNNDFRVLSTGTFRLLRIRILGALNCFEEERT